MTAEWLTRRVGKNDRCGQDFSSSADRALLNLLPRPCPAVHSTAMDR